MLYSMTEFAICLVIAFILIGYCWLSVILTIYFCSATVISYCHCKQNFALYLAAITKCLSDRKLNTAWVVVRGVMVMLLAYLGVMKVVGEVGMDGNWTQQSYD